MPAGHVVTDIFHEHRNEGRRLCNNAPNVAKKRMISMAIRPEVFPDPFSDCHSQMELLHINPQPGLRVIDEDKHRTILRGGGKFAVSFDLSPPPLDRETPGEKSYLVRTRRKETPSWLINYRDTLSVEKREMRNDSEPSKNRSVFSRILHVAIATNFYASFFSRGDRR